MFQNLPISARAAAVVLSTGQICSIFAHAAAVVLSMGQSWAISQP